MHSSISCNNFDSGTNIPTWDVTSGSGTLLYQSDDRCDSYSVSMSFPGLPQDSPVNFLFQPPDCNGLIELSFPLAPDFPAGMACLINACHGVSASATMILATSQSNATWHGERPTINGTASCTPGGEAVMNTFVQGSNPLRNSTAYGHAPYGMNSTSAFQATSNGNAAGTGTGPGRSLGGAPSNGTDGALNNPQGSIATPTSPGSAPTIAGPGMGNGAPPATPITTGIAAASSPDGDSLPGAPPASTLLTITTPSTPGLNGSQPVGSPGGTPVSTGLAGAGQAASTGGSDYPAASVTTPSLASQTPPPHQIVDGQEIPYGGGPAETTPAVTQTPGTNGAPGGDVPVVTDPGQSAAASTCRCN